MQNVKKGGNMLSSSSSSNIHHLGGWYTTNTIFYGLKYQGEKTKVVKMDNNNNYNNDIKVQIMLNQYIYIYHPIYGGKNFLSLFSSTIPLM
jgi:hypothetical protein